MKVGLSILVFHGLLVKIKTEEDRERQDEIYRLRPVGCLVVGDSGTMSPRQTNCPRA